MNLKNYKTMKQQAFKHSIIWLFLLGITIGYSQQSDKKVEKFKVNANPTLEIDASHTDVTIKSWNKNEILVEATIEIEGATEEQAKNILESWNFQALGNSNKVKVESFGNVFLHDIHGDFEFIMPEMVIEIPEIEFPEMEIVLPEFEFEMPEIEILDFLIEIPEMEIEIEEFDYEAYEKDSTYLKKYKEKVAKQVKVFKESGLPQKMDSLRNSKEFKEQMKAVKEAQKQAAIQMKAYKESAEFKQAIEAREQAMEQVQQQMESVREQIEMQRELFEKQRAIGVKANEKVMAEIKKAQAENANIKIKRKVNIKAPKDTKYDLNVKHGKLDVPESAIKMSAKVSYGNFVAGTLSGEDTKVVIANSPVVVNAMKAGNITLRNVPNAVFGAFSNANLFSDHSEVLVQEVGSNVSMSQKFGFLEIDKFAADFQKFNLILDYAKAQIDVANRDFDYTITGKNSTFHYSENFRSVNPSKVGGVYKLKGVYGKDSSANTLNITGVYSTLTIN